MQTNNPLCKTCVHFNLCMSYIDILKDFLKKIKTTLECSPDLERSDDCDFYLKQQPQERLIGQHWCGVAAERILAGEPEETVMNDYGYFRKQLQEETAIVKLKPCPFCGSKAVIDKIGSQFYPRCLCNQGNGYCIASRYPIKGEDGFVYLKDAIEIWNRRTLLQ